MPFYEYECPHCRYYAEVMQKISDAPLRKCPSCGKGGFKRLISAPVFRLKGSGWYETDFKSDKENKRNLSGPDREDSKPAEAKPAETKPAEAKPDAKETAKTETPAAKPVEQAKSATARGSRRRGAAASRTPARKKAGVRKHK